MLACRARDATGLAIGGDWSTVLYLTGLHESVWGSSGVGDVFISRREEFGVVASQFRGVVGSSVIIVGLPGLV